MKLAGQPDRYAGGFPIAERRDTIEVDLITVFDIAQQVAKVATGPIPSAARGQVVGRRSST
jgi:hypothetical protein